MSIADRLRDYVNAGFSGIWINSREHDDAEAEIKSLATAEGWSLGFWDCDRGLTLPHHGTNADAVDILPTLRAIPQLAGDRPGLMILRNAHHYTGNPEIAQAIDTQICEGKTRGTFVVILAPSTTLPDQIDRLFVTIDHDLPDRDQLSHILSSVATEEHERPEGPELGRTLDAASGLTRLEAEGAFALALARHGKVSPAPVWEIKTNTLAKSGRLTLHRGGETFDDLGGLSTLKEFGRRALRPGRSSRVKARGALLLGVPGTGKSAFAKALGNATDRPTLSLDLGACKASHVGESERNIREALRAVDAMSPCILFVDEIEKGLAGVAGGGNDSGVSADIFGTLLKWLNDHDSDVFSIMTSNNIAGLPPEFARAERFDGIFFLDLPGPDERAAIWHQYRSKYDIGPADATPQDDRWTGAEIKSCCRLAALLRIPLIDAARNVVPVASTAGEQIDGLRRWASGRCLSANRPGIYQHDAPQKPHQAEADRPRRKVRRREEGEAS